MSDEPIVTGGTGPYTFSASGLPAGVVIDEKTGTIRSIEEPTPPGFWQRLFRRFRARNRYTISDKV